MEVDVMDIYLGGPSYAPSQALRTQTFALGAT